MATQFNITQETSDDNTRCFVYATETGTQPDAEGRNTYWTFGNVAGQVVKLHGTKEEVMEAYPARLDIASLDNHLTVFRVALENFQD